VLKHRKPRLHSTDIDCATVGDIVSFIKKSLRFSSSIQWQLEFQRGGLSLRGYKMTWPFWNPDPGASFSAGINLRNYISIHNNIMYKNKINGTKSLVNW